MRPVSATATIDVPRERIFALLEDLSVRPGFTDHFLSDYRLARVEPVGIGASARFHLVHSGVWVDTAIVVADSPHLIREEGRGGRGNRVPWFTVWEMAEGPVPATTEITVTIWTEPKTVFDRLGESGISGRRLRRDLRKALARLREIAENDSPLEHVSVGGGDALPAFNR